MLNRLFAAAVFSVAILMAADTCAQDINLSQGVDLILAPALETPDAPFYRGARVKMGSSMMPVLEDQLPNGVLAAYMPERNAVVVSNDASISENRKAQALMDVVGSMGLSDIATAAGTE
jgi:hypothetical protein